MLQVDVLSGYFICGVGSLVGAAMLRIAESNDARTKQALRQCRWGFVLLGVGLLPAGFGDAVVRLGITQFSLAFGCVAGIALIGAGAIAIRAKSLPPGLIAGFVIAYAVVLGVALHDGLRALGIAFAAGLLTISLLVVWLTRGLFLHPRDITDRALAASMLVLTLSCGLRLAFTLTDTGAVRADLMYVPEPFRSLLAVLYGVLPMIVATLTLTLVNSRLRHQLRVRATTDELTGSMTRRALRELAPALMLREQRSGRCVAVLMLDLDRFKAINDGYGHPVGDAVLRLAAKTLQAQIRADALFARYGGEEFVAVAPVDDLQTAQRVAERLRQAVEEADWRGQLALPDAVTVSVGVAMIGPADDLDAAITRADEALYRAKRNGRNRCEIELAPA